MSKLEKPEKSEKNVNYFKRLMAEGIRAQRNMAKLSQDQLAERSGLSQRTISNLENEKSNIGFATFIQCADGLGIDPIKLLLRGFDRNGPPYANLTSLEFPEEGTMSILPLPYIGREWKYVAYCKAKIYGILIYRNIDDEWEKIDNIPVLNERHNNFTSFVEKLNFQNIDYIQALDLIVDFHSSPDYFCP